MINVSAWPTSPLQQLCNDSSSHFEDTNRKAFPCQGRYSWSSLLHPQFCTKKRIVTRHYGLTWHESSYCKHQWLRVWLRMRRPCAPGQVWWVWDSSLSAGDYPIRILRQVEFIWAVVFARTWISSKNTTEVCPVVVFGPGWDIRQLWQENTDDWVEIENYVDTCDGIKIGKAWNGSTKISRRPPSRVIILLHGLPFTSTNS